MRKIVVAFVIGACICFAAWYFPVSYVNVFACDDYWHGANVHSFGFWGSQLHYWLNWEGSFTHTLFATIPHIIPLAKIPFICNMISLALLVISCAFFFKSFHIVKSNRWIWAAYMSAVLFTFSSGEAEIRFWTCANFTYITGISFTLFFFALYHCRSNWKCIDYLLAICLILLIVGNKLTYIALLFIGMLLNDVIYHNRFNRSQLILYLIVASTSLFNVLAPGNFTRLQENLSEFQSHMPFADTCLSRIDKLYKMFIGGIFLFPMSLFVHHSYSNKANLVIIVSAYVAYFFIDTLIMFICFRNDGPLRANVLLEVCTLFLILYLLVSIIPHSHQSRLIIGLSLLFPISMMAFDIKPFSKISKTVEYSNAAIERDRIVSNSMKTSTIIVDKLPDSYLLLSYYANDEMWIENVYSAYFNKQCCLRQSSESNVGIY